MFPGNPTLRKRPIARRTDSKRATPARTSGCAPFLGQWKMETAGMTDEERIALAREIALAARAGTGSIACACESPAPSHAPNGQMPTALAPLLDQALPHPSASLAEARRFLADSRHAGFRSVCVQSAWAGLAVRMLGGSDARVAAFIGFPQATALTPTKCLEAEILLRLGVHELTMIADIGALRSGDLDRAYIDIQAVSRVAACRGASLNVFLELPLLGRRRKAEACAVAKLAGASAVLSATGYGGSDADPKDIEIMHRAVGADLDVVAAGGVHSRAAAQRLIEAGASRVCTSHGLEIAAPELA